MKSLLVLLGLFLIGAKSEETLKPVDAINGSEVGSFIKIGFDGQGNAYVETRYLVQHDPLEYIQRLFKLNPERELLQTVVLPDGVEFLTDMFVTSYGDVYFSWETLKITKKTFGILRSGSNSVDVVERIEDYPNDLFFMDNHDNLLYARQNGLHILKPNAPNPILIKNLEGFGADPLFQNSVVDNLGNIYFGVRDSYGSWVALLTKESLQMEVPEAKLYLVTKTPEGSKRFRLTIDKFNDLWLAENTNHGFSSVHKLIKENLELIKIDNTHPEVTLTAANNKIYVTVEDYLHTSNPKISYITVDDDKEVEIPELKNFTSQYDFQTKAVADVDGNFYSMTWNKHFTPELGPIIAITANDPKVVPVHLGSTFSTMYEIHMDDHGNVWLVTSSTNDFIYFVKKGETVAKRLDVRNEDKCTHALVSTNPVTKEVFVACELWLYAL